MFCCCLIIWLLTLVTCQTYVLCRIWRMDSTMACTLHQREERRASSWMRNDLSVIILSLNLSDILRYFGRLLNLRLLIDWLIFITSRNAIGCVLNSKFAVGWVLWVFGLNFHMFVFFVDSWSTSVGCISCCKLIQRNWSNCTQKFVFNTM